MVSRWCEYAWDFTISSTVSYNKDRIKDRLLVKTTKVIGVTTDKINKVKSKETKGEEITKTGVGIELVTEWYRMRSGLLEIEMSPLYLDT